ncbi:MAG: MarR family winged helix-turn-helix transcriptional regulator [Actinomycetota bacterium]
MNTTQDTDTTSRPLGYWVKAVDRLLADAFATAFESEEASRRDWRMLSVIDGSAPSSRPIREHKLHRLVERGWIARDGESWSLTDEGREAKERLGALVDGIRGRVADAVPAEDLATTLATLEQIARTLGWDESTPLPRGGHGRRHRFGSRRGRGPGHGFGQRQGAGGPDDAHCAHGHGPRGRHHGEHGPGERGHGHHGEHRRGEHRTQHAYERGFDAGFSRGRDTE